MSPVAAFLAGRLTKAEDSTLDSKVRLQMSGKTKTVQKKEVR